MIFWEYFINKAEAEILKRIDIILCVETSVNTMQLYVFNLGLLQMLCLSRAELNSLFKFDFGMAVAWHLKQFKN